MCDKRFTEKGNLKKHVDTVHLKIKEYICVKCDKWFTQKGSLKTHMKAVHFKN